MLQYAITPIKKGKSCGYTTSAIQFSLPSHFGFQKNGLRNLVLLKKFPTFVIQTIFKIKKMAEIKKNISKEIFIQQIVNEINEIPAIYLQTLYGLVHTFKENILIVTPQASTTLVTLEDTFDWDDLMNDIYINRQKNNELLTKRMETIL
jgi:hypothetical protein